MAKDPRMSALDKVEGMVKGVGRAVGGGGMAGGMKPKPNPYGKAKRLTDRTMKKAGDKIAGRNTWQRAKTLAGDAGRAAGARASGASLEREPLTKAGSKKMSR